MENIKFLFLIKKISINRNSEEYTLHYSNLELKIHMNYISSLKKNNMPNGF